MENKIYFLFFIIYTFVTYFFQKLCYNLFIDTEKFINLKIIQNLKLVPQFSFKE